MRQIGVKIDYRQVLQNGSEDDILTFLCPYKKYYKNMCRDDIENYELAGLVDETEFEYLHSMTMFSLSSEPLEFTIKVSEEIYKYLFLEQIDYTDDKRDTDLSNIFIWLSWKIRNIYNNVESYNRYLSAIDYDGSLDGCTYCEYWINNYCTKLKSSEQKNRCIFYKFKKNN